MKIARYDDGGSAAWGIVEGETLHAATGSPFDGSLTRGAAVGPLEEATLLTPVDPGKIVCVGLNYAAHVTENDPSRTVPDEPVIFMKPQSALIPQGAAITIANPGNQTDYEAELAIVIGRTASKVSVEEARGVILGFTVGNDVSDRVLQKKDGQWVRAKGYDTYCPLGPVIVTDLDPTAGEGLRVQSRLNGQLRQNGVTTDMIFDVYDLISRISHVMTLNPGDVILTGTPENVGGLSSGDVIECEVTGIGILRNTVA
ncbi:MAG TPA: fumarylacetoacetate hydrolase family protein [Thermomicrobiales bacterium]|jgi:2-keto-4-pentenoate hydratase/2-oxohepta-3-ene-1,7-dioic acid hydratase in catechol pathway|nr:fumarylacetoacetate hydrolase family protein [Thermomicrobiales bacterium]